MKININNFEDFNDELYDLVIVPEENDVGGGRIKKEEIDIIKKYPDAKSLKISGLNQESFEHLIVNYGHQFEAIFFFKNKLVSDLSLLADLHELKYVIYFFNQGATDLWDMSKNKSLKGVAIYDFCRLHSIEMISTAPNLETFSIGDMVWAGTEIESLRPIINSSVTCFSWWGKKVKDNNFLCLAQSKVKELNVNICQFKMDELAQLVAAIPGVKGSVTIPYKKQRIIEGGEETIFYYLCKGKRSLVKGKDDKKIENYIWEFDKLVEKYRV